MTIMAWRDAVCRLCCQDLVGLGLPIGPSLLLETGLEKPTATTTAKVIGPVGCHVDKIFFAHNRFDNIS
jgi:hypothetical protein